MEPSRLLKQIDFLLEIDKLKSVYRQTLLTDSSRNENSAEHTWHICIFALILQEHSADRKLDVLRVIKMMLIHDIVEIDCGDTFVYDVKANIGKVEREREAANRLFGLLPEDQAREFTELWEEFEARQTPESRYAAALDRLQPLLHNIHTQGAAWQKHGVKLSQVLERNRQMEEGAPALWEYTTKLLEQAVQNGILAEG